MANQNTTYGLRPVRLHGAEVANESARPYYVPAGNTNALFVGDPVVKIAGSTAPNGVKGVDLATSGGPVTGVVVGFQGTAIAGSNVSQPFLPMNFGPFYRPATTALDYYVLVEDDPSIEFSIQLAGTAIMAQTNIGEGGSITLGAGSPYTGWSGATLSNTTTDTGAQQVIIIGKDSVANNDVTLPYAKYIVRINNSTEAPGANVAGI